MNEEVREGRVPVVRPRDAGEAASLFAAAACRRKKGRDFRLRLVDSPFVDEVWVKEAAGGGLRVLAPEEAEELADLPAGGVVAVSSAAMDRVEEVSAGDLLAVCGGGVKLSDLRSEVAREGLFFPFDPELAPADVTLAELVMGGAVSRYEGRYGRLREYILSLSLVTGQGEIVRTGTRSVKNVAGYEITGLAVGAGSSCGLVSSVTVRLLPAPKSISLALVPGEHHSLLHDTAGREAESGAASVELFRGASARALLGRDPREVGMPGGGGGSVLLVESHDGDRRESGLLSGLRRELPARLAESGMESYEAVDLDGLRPEEPPPGDGWCSIRPNREVILFPGSRPGLDAAGGKGRSGRCEQGMWAPAAGGTRILKVRTRRGGPPSGKVAEMEERLRKVFDPCGIFVED